MKYLTYYICGLLFGAGLTISNMINPNKVLGFLDIAGQWDASLAFVMLGALIVVTPGYRYLYRKLKPVYCETFSNPDKTKIDTKLVMGAIIFGIGWGMSGYCPAPGLTAIGLAITEAFYFVAGMCIGSLIYFIVIERRQEKANA